MNTTRFIDNMLRASNGGYSRQEMLGIVNDAQNKLLDVDTMLTRRFPEYQLTTVKGQLEYLLPLGIRSARRVYFETDTSYKDVGYPSRYDSWRTRTEDVQVINCGIQQSHEPDSQVKIVFQDDPGDTSGVYLIECYNWQPQLDTEAVPLTIPDAYQMTALRSQAMVWIEEENYGNSTYWVQKLDKDLPDFIRGIQRGKDYTSDQLTYNPAIGG